MTHRGITLIELLIAIAILLAIGAIVTPIMVRTLDERRFESAAEQVEMQLLLARSYAQRTGELVEVRYHSDSRRIVARRFMRGSDSDALSDSRAAPPPWDASEPARGATFGTFEDADDESAIAEAWAMRVLLRGIELSDQRPEREIASDMPGRVRQQAPMSMMEDPNAAMRSDLMPDDEPIRLAVFLPDGSAMLTRTVWLTDNNARLGRIRVSTWTGTAKYERLPDLTDDVPIVNDADDEEVMRNAFDTDW